MDLTRITETYTQLGRLGRQSGGGLADAQAFGSKRLLENLPHGRIEAEPETVEAAPFEAAESRLDAASAMELTAGARRRIMDLEPSSLPFFLQDPGKVRMISSRYV